MTQVPIRILVIEDEPQMQKFLGASLSSEGYRTLEATTGKEGVELARTHNPDLVLLDLGLPDTDGMDVTRSLRELSARPIIVISARGQEEDKVRVLLQGVVHDHVRRHEVVKSLDGEVENRGFSIGFDRQDRIPVDVTRRQASQLFGADRARHPRRTSATHARLVESSPTIGGTDGGLHPAGGHSGMPHRRNYQLAPGLKGQEVAVGI